MNKMASGIFMGLFKAQEIFINTITLVRGLAILFP